MHGGSCEERPLTTPMLALVLAAVATSAASAQSLQVAGKAGYLQEWELAATVTPRTSRGKTEFSGPLTLKHVGVCSTGGIEEKSGEIRFEMLGAASRIKAKLVVDGAECAFSGTLSEAATGVMECPGTQGVPLSLWTK
jgi:hypothetical protein